MPRTMAGGQNIRWVISALFAVPAAFVFFFWITQSRVAGIDAFVQRIGFYPINPPTRLRNPGSIYQISPDGRAYTMLCEVPPDLLSAKIRSSDTERYITSELSNFTIKASAEAFKKATGDFQQALLQQISLSLDNVKVMEVSLSNLSEIAATLQNNDPNCASQVLAYLTAGDYVCQIQEIFAASTVYTLDKNSGAGASTTLEDLNNVLKSTLDPNARITTSTNAIGNDLYYGMRPTPRCLYLSGRKPPLAPISWWNRFQNKPLGLGYF